MHRFLGKKKAKEPTPTLDDATANMEKRGDYLDGRIKKLDAELLRYKTQMKRMKPGAAKKSVMGRAMKVLKQKKMYEKQRDGLYQQQFNVDQTRLAQENLKDVGTTVAAMKQAQKELKQQFKTVDIDEIEDLHDDMSDLLEDSEEIQDILGREYGVPEELDEADLEEELAALEEMDELDGELEEDEVPSYLVSAASAGKKHEAVANPELEPQSEEQDVDEYGLPRAPVRSVNA